MNLTPSGEESSPRAGRVQAVCWDLGGVLLRTFRWTQRRAWEIRLGVPPGGLERRVFEGEVGRRAMVGQATADDVWDDLALNLGLSPGDRKRLAADFFDGDRLDDVLLSYVTSLRPRFRTALISNAWPGIRAVLGESAGEGVFDEMVISAEVGQAKPDPAIYYLALERLKIPASAALFIDDMPVNLEAARAAGMRTLLFNGTRKTIEALDRALGS